MQKKYLLDDSLGYKLFHASRLMSVRLNQNFKAHDFPLTYEQWQIMSRLFEKDGLTQHKIALLNERDQGSVSRLVDNMIKRDLVKRVPHSNDKRVNLIFLTEKGKELKNSLNFLALQTIDEASKGIQAKDLEICLKVLDKIRENLK